MYVTQNKNRHIKNFDVNVKNLSFRSLVRKDICGILAAMIASEIKRVELVNI